VTASFHIIGFICDMSERTLDLIVRLIVRVQFLLFRDQLGAQRVVLRLRRRQVELKLCVDLLSTRLVANACVSV
jgi:hypothetical protein